MITPMFIFWPAVRYRLTGIIASMLEMSVASSMRCTQSNVRSRVSGSVECFGEVPTLRAEIGEWIDRDI